MNILEEMTINLQEKLLITMTYQQDRMSINNNKKVEASIYKFRI